MGDSARALGPLSPILEGRDHSPGGSVVLWTNLVFTFDSFRWSLMGAGAWEPDFRPKRGRAPEAEQRGEVALMFPRLCKEVEGLLDFELRQRASGSCEVWAGVQCCGSNAGMSSVRVNRPVLASSGRFWCSRPWQVWRGLIAG